MFGQVLSKCIFCTSACNPKISVSDGKTSLGRNESGSTTANNVLPPTRSISTQFPQFLMEGQACAQQATELNSIFILRNILDIREDKLYQFFVKLAGNLSTELWLHVCTACGEAVKEFYVARKEFLRLQKKLTVISNELKGHVRETREVDYKAVNEATGQVWKEVREEVLKEFGFNSFARQHDSLPSTDEHIQDGIPPLNQETYLPAQEDQSINENQSLKKRKLVTTPIDFDYKPAHDSLSPMVILPPDVYIVEQDEADINTYDIISGDILSDSNHGDDSNIIEEHHIGHDYQIPASSQSQINSRNCLQNQQLNHNGLNIPSSSTSMQRSYEILSPFRQSELDSVRRYPLPTLPFSDCPRFSGVQKGKERHYECLECLAKSNHWETFKAHLELHHPTSGAVACGKCGWLVHPGKMLRHNSRYHLL